MVQAPQVVTLKTAAPTVGVIRHIVTSIAPFDPVCFDADALQREGLLEGAASAGRGNTVFFRLHDDALVLRHYRRGGLIRHISKSHYVFTGYQATRALLEFDLLVQLQTAGLPAPPAYACQVVRKGLLYTASLVTFRLPGRTLAQAIDKSLCKAEKAQLDDLAWRAIGEVIGQFHTAGICHADLNAHNIMIDDSQRVSLIDFDRGTLRPLPANPAKRGWCVDNMNRLERSINKIVARQSATPLITDAIRRDFQGCKAVWAERMQALSDSARK